jgi:hypothetical protein
MYLRKLDSIAALVAEFSPSDDISEFVISIWKHGRLLSRR